MRRRYASAQSMEARRIALPVLRAPRSRILDAALPVISSTWTLGALVFVLTWGGGMPAPVSESIDHSLHAGLQLAAVHGLNFGSDLVFTYGPLGFLKSYLLYEEWPGRLAVVYGVALHLALSLTLVWAARRSFGIVLGLVLALIAATLIRGDLGVVAVRDDAAVVVIAFVWCVAALQSGSPTWVRRLVVWGGGPFAAIEILAKLNTGIIVLALVALTVIAIDIDRRRNLALLAVSFAGSVALLWLATGQAVADVGEFLSGSREIISGYSTGARLEWEQRRYDYALLPLVLVATAAIGWFATRRMAGLRRAVILAMLALVAFTSAKGGLIAHDEYHMATFYGTMLGACLALPLPATIGLRPRVAALAAITGIAAAGFTTAYLPLYPLINPVENVSNAASTLATVADVDRLEDEIAANRAQLIADYDIDARSLALLEGHTVHADPQEVAALWAYGLEWRPLPVFQPYAAWTEELDRRNAEVVASAGGPERILRQNISPLGRYPAFESPEAMLAMLCHFEAERTTHEWQVLARVPDRCGEPEPLGRVQSTYGQAIPVPEGGSDEVVFARVEGVQVSGIERLRTLIYRSKARSIRFGGTDRHRPLIPTTAGDGLLLRAPGRIDFPAPFALAPNVDEFTLYLNGEATDDPITVEYFAMRVKPRSAARR
jgi:hypothetical protein